MRFIAMLLAALLGAAGSEPARADNGHVQFHVGQASRQVHPAQPRNWRGARTEALATRIWYPVDASIPEQPYDIGPPGTPFFKGEPHSAGAPLSSDQNRYPLILMSHGTGGLADNMDWIAAPLARAGYIVAAVDHPGNNARGPLTWDGFTLWWERARDLSDVLDALTADPAFGGHVDRDRIGALGFSIGGYTVLELAGARTNLAAFRAVCAGPTADAVCHPPEMDRVIDRPAPGAEPSDARRASLARAGDSYRDARIRAVFAIAPAVGPAFDAASFRDVRIPVAMLVGAFDRIAPPAANAAHIASLLPAAKLTIAQTAGHYSYLPVCAAAANARMPALCREEPGVDRAAIHADAVGQARAFFQQTLQPPAGPPRSGP